ncbi:MAG: ferredoxin [Candidatus Dojkabacteria bacterium]|jgi:ferredoxin|nr:ferredoxin [Candidatus Dojkabacteria bacterium]MDD4561385.1 ferredoxin [Candidatus Dojkabacteria bacterium]NLB12375.1 ferredoxin [Candidatus Dojkabacteria bacterium]
MKVVLDKEKCTLCFSCVAICPEVFEGKEDGTVDVKEEYKGVEITDENLKEKIREAAEACPAMAITIEE